MVTLLKISIPAIAEEVTKLTNHFITSQSWPTEWKSSNVTPVFKKDDETNKTNYRSISILSALSKVYEKVIHNQMYSTFSPYLSTNLSGFLKGHSCLTALLKMTEDWRANLDNRKSVAVVAVDLSKAFDSVCHNLLIAKLKAYGFSIEALNLMKNYLLNRRQRVTITGIYSNWRTITTGLPQGKFLAPFLSNLFMNDLNYFVSNISLRLYADDTTEYFADHSPMALEHIINNELNTLTEWFDWNILVTNPSKTQALTLRPKTYNYDLKMNDLPIEIKDPLKILGINIDGKLTCERPIKECLCKMFSFT